MEIAVNPPTPALSAPPGGAPSEQPVCSVCIANYNGMAFIDACIRSVQAQDCAFAVEIIVHDDASTDGSVAHIKEHYPEVSLIASPENVGFCISNNRMVQAARGQYVLLLNNDAELLPDALSSLHQEAQTLKVPAVLGLPQYDAASKELIDMGSRLDPFLNPIPNLHSDREIGMVIGACLWLPKSLWQELGGFPAWFGSLAEDMYLCLQARLYGIPVKVLPRSGFLHWVGQSLGGGKVVDHRLSTKLSRRIVSERNKSYVMVMLYPAPFLQLLLPLHLGLLLLEGLLLAALKGRFDIFTDIYLNCPRMLWKNRKLLGARRRDLQGRRLIGRIAFFKVFQKFPHKLRLLFKHGIPKIQ